VFEENSLRQLTNPVADVAQVKALHLFGLQRAAIKKNCDDNSKPYPWDVAYKNMKRKQTAQSGSERQKKQREDSKQVTKAERQKSDTRHKK